MSRKPRLATLGFVTTIAATSLSARAGDLNPPAGPVAPTLKTLTEVEPRTAINITNTPGDADSLFRIAQRGSYYLTGNIAGVAGKHGIEIAISGVTLDLSGFDLLGGAGSLDGVSVSIPGLTNIAVVNGSVRNWGGNGVNLSSFGADNCRVADLLAGGNAAYGIRTGDGSTVTNCAAFGNGLIGIDIGDGSAINNCSAYFNAGSGIDTEHGCAVTNCSSYANTFQGIDAGIGSTLSNCTAYQNFSDGINISSGSSITSCSAFQNHGSGIATNEGCTIVNCSARSNFSSGISTGNDCALVSCAVTFNEFVGVDAGARCTILKSTVGATIDGPGVLTTFGGLRIEGSTINANSTFGVIVNTASDIAELAIVNCTIRLNTSAGINSEASTQVLDSIVSSNGTSGIILTGSSFVRGCTITSNASSGVELLGNANVVANNTVSSNAPSLATAAGILVQGTDNTIDGNRLFSNVQGGIKVNSAGNLVLRNYLARSGATITAVAGNAVAQILSPGAAFVSTDPNANLTY